MRDYLQTEWVHCHVSASNTERAQALAAFREVNAATATVNGLHPSADYDGPDAQTQLAHSVSTAGVFTNGRAKRGRRTRRMFADRLPSSSRNVTQNTDRVAGPHVSPYDEDLL